MKRNYQLFALTLVTSLLLFICACSPGAIVVSSETPKPVPTVVPTPTPTATPSPTPTVEPSPTPTPRNIEAKAGIKKGRDKVEAEVNQRFEDFLNGTGEFTDKKISDNGFTPTFYDGAADYSDLGCIIVVEENFFEVQGVILYYERVTDGEVIAFGTKNKNGERFIALVELPSQIYISDTGRIIFNLHTDPEVCNLEATSDKRFGSRDLVYYDFLSSFVGKIGCTVFYTCVGSEIYGNTDCWTDEVKKLHAEAFDPKIAVNSAFMTNIYFLDCDDNGVKNAYESVRRFYEAEEEYIVTVSSFNDFEEFIRTGDYDKIPNCDGFRFIIDG